MKQQEAKQRAETLLYRRVKLKQRGGKCMIFPSTTRGRLIESVTFAKTTDYYGSTWDEAITKIEDHVRFDSSGQPYEAELIRCPNCGEHEYLNFDETIRKFNCESCAHAWDADQNTDIVAEMAPPQVTREGNIAGEILLTDESSSKETTEQEG